MLCPRDPAAAGYALFKDAAVLGRAAPIARERVPLNANVSNRADWPRI
jgi:hypothetical protein